MQHSDIFLYSIVKDMSTSSHFRALTQGGVLCNKSADVVLYK